MYQCFPTIVRYVIRFKMETLEAITPAIEIYSIDETFVDLTGMDANFDLLTCFEIPCLSILVLAWWWESHKPKHSLNWPIMQPKPTLKLEAWSS